MHGLRFVTVAATLICTLGLEQQAKAGKVLYQQCANSLGGPSNSFTGVLMAGGLFYSWAGYSINAMKPGCVPNNAIAPDLFSGSSGPGVNNFSSALAGGGLMTGQMMKLNFISNDTPIDKNASMFYNNGNMVGTKIGDAVTSAKNDPIIDITNGGSSAITLDDITAQIFNSEDPLNPSIFFVPDGEDATVTPTLSVSNETIDPGDTAEFTFQLDGSPNWSFEYTYTDQGVMYTDLLASDVPEPSAWQLAIIGLAAFAVGCVWDSRRGFSRRIRVPR